MKDDLHIHDLSGLKWQLALDHLEDGRRFIYEDIAFQITQDGHLNCSVQSSWTIENVSEKTARMDFARAKTVFDHLNDSSPEFRSLVRDRQAIWTLVEDYSLGYVSLCRLREERIEWGEGISRSQR